MIAFRVQDRRPLACIAVGGFIIATLAAGDAAGLRVNSTASMPVGLWRLVDMKAPPRSGEIVSICPPDTVIFQQGLTRGYIPSGGCPGGYEPLVKPVAAVAGDIVTVAGSGVLVNGELVAGTAQLPQDSAGRELRGFEAGTYTVAPGQVWLLSGHDPRSFDSRYYGPMPLENVQGLALPVWVAR